MEFEIIKGETSIIVRVKVKVRKLARDKKEQCTTPAVLEHLRDNNIEVGKLRKRGYVNNYASPPQSEDDWVFDKPIAPPAKKTKKKATHGRRPPRKTTKKDSTGEDKLLGVEGSTRVPVAAQETLPGKSN